MLKSYSNFYLLILYSCDILCTTPFPLIISPEMPNYTAKWNIVHINKRNYKKTSLPNPRTTNDWLNTLQSGDTEMATSSLWNTQCRFIFNYEMLFHQNVCITRNRSFSTCKHKDQNSIFFIMNEFFIMKKVLKRFN